MHGSVSGRCLGERSQTLCLVHWHRRLGPAGLTHSGGNPETCSLGKSDRAIAREEAPGTFLMEALSPECVNMSKLIELYSKFSVIYPMQIYTSVRKAQAKKIYNSILK